MKKIYRVLAVALISIALVSIAFTTCCTVVDSGEVGIMFHKWSASEQDYGGVAGTCKGWVFYNPITMEAWRERRHPYELEQELKHYKDLFKQRK